MDEPSVAKLLLDSSANDLRAIEVLATIPDIHDSVIGFHAQQAVEKSLKAVLARSGIAFRRTHDLAELLDAIADARLASPPHSDRLDELQPYAVDARYGLIQPGQLDRPSTLAMTTEVVGWARALLNTP